MGVCNLLAKSKMIRPEMVGSSRGRERSYRQGAYRNTKSGPQAGYLGQQKTCIAAWAGKRLNSYPSKLAVVQLYARYSIMDPTFNPISVQPVRHVL